MTRYAVCLLFLFSALTLSACGNDSTKGNANSASGKSTPTEAPTAPPKPEPEPEPEPDRDDDGTPDADDFAPSDSKIQTEADAEDCDVLGINAEKRKEGSCVDSEGGRVKIVNRATKLTLPQVTVKLNSIQAVKSIAREFDTPLVGSYVVANVTISSRLDVTTEVSGSDMFALGLGSRTYNPDFDAMNTGMDDSLVGAELQPDQSITGDVIFVVARKRTGALDRNGNLFVLQFSDTEFGSEEAEKTVGIIRTYN